MRHLEIFLTLFQHIFTTFHSGFNSMLLKICYITEVCTLCSAAFFTLPSARFKLAHNCRWIKMMMTQTLYKSFPSSPFKLFAIFCYFESCSSSFLSQFCVFIVPFCLLKITEIWAKFDFLLLLNSESILCHFLYQFACLKMNLLKYEQNLT